MSNDAKSTSDDLFPQPIGEKIIPMDQDLFSHFHYVEFDTNGALLLRMDDLSLEVRKWPWGLYGNTPMYTYAFEDPRRGHLLIWNDGATNRDSAGVYIVGTFDDTLGIKDTVPTLWIPQFPKSGKSWPIDGHAVMELVSADTVYYSEPLFSNDPAKDTAP